MLTKHSPETVIEVVCRGTPREMGLAQGAGLQSKLHAARVALADLEAFRLQQPWWLPYGAYRWLAEQKASRFLAGPLSRDCAPMSERLAGIAEGAAIGLNAVYLFNALEPVLSSVGGCTACPGACSSVAVRGRRSINGEPMIAHNFDYLPLVQPFYVMRESRPQGNLRAFEFTTAPLAGAVDGLNEAGLCITYNYAFTIDEPTTAAAPISMAVSQALGQCSTVAEAAERISSQPRWGGGMLLMCDASGDIASLELSSTRSNLRRPDPGEDVLYNANAFSSDYMREVQIPRDAVYTNLAPKALRGRRLHQSSELRNRRFSELLKQNEALGPDELAAVMADHGPSGEPDHCTPCVHSDYWQTTGCLQFYPKSRRVRVAYDSACQARFADAEL